jgi:hypothetical protein
MMRARTVTRVALATLTVCALAAAPASARLVRHVSSFTPTGVEEPSHVAVEQATGAVYVIGVLSKVEKFSASGVPEPSFASPVFGGEAEGVAVDNSGGASKGDVYVTGKLEAKVIKLDSSGGEVAGFPPLTTSSIPAGDPGSESFVPVSVAVDPSNGDVIVLDEAHGEIDIFSSSGVFVSQFKASGKVSAVAVGSNDEIFTAARGEGAQEWSPADKYETPIQIGPSETAYAVAVDLSTGDVLVNQPEEPRQVNEYEASGAHTLLLQFGLGLVEFSRGVAVDEATDTVYAMNPGLDSVEVFAAPLVFAEVLTGAPATGVTSTSADVSGTVDPEGATVTGCSFEYGLSASYGYTSPCSPAAPLTGRTAIPVVAGLEGLHPDESYHYRLVAVNAAGTEYGEDETFQTEAPPPTLSTSVSAVTQTTATLDGSIDPNDQETTYRFEYGPTVAYGTVLPAPEASVGSGYEEVHVGQELSGLQPGTTYHFRVVATNASSPPGGTVGPDETFTTPPLQPPVVDTGQAVGVAQNTATLIGTVDTQGFQTDYEFDLGTDTSYGTRIFGNAGAEPGTQTFTVMLQGLMPGTTYYYRIAATNTFGTTYGIDVTFTTSTYPSATLTVPVSEPFVSSILLAPAPSASLGAAKTASVQPVVRAARAGRARKSSAKRPGRYRRKGRSGEASHAHGGNRGKVGR